MINNYRKLTWKYIKANKKRTLLTIIGIVLSVALICTIGLFFKGIQAAEIEQMKNNYGSSHLTFKKTNDELISKIVNNPKVSRYGFYTEGDEIKLGDKIVTKEQIATDKALELLPCKIKKGRLPKDGKEVAIENWLLGYINKDIKIGDKVQLGNKECTLVGILEDQSDKGLILFKTDKITTNNKALLVEISSKTNLKTAVNELSKLADKDTVTKNKYLLSVQGAGDDSAALKGLYTTIGIIIGIVVIATIAVIYNSFQISVVERIKQFGLLRAVGATPKQIRKIVLREATMLAAVGIPLGLLCGIIAIYGINIAFKLIGGDSVFAMKPVIDPMVMAISAAVGIVAIYLSALIPSHFAGKISPLVAISSRTSITKENIKRRNNPIVQKIFGFEGALAAKNIKRNKKRYRITVFSIVISVVLFVTFKSFMDMTLKFADTPNESKNIHFVVTRDKKAEEDNLKIDNSIVNNIKSLNSVDKVYKAYDTLNFHAAIDKNNEIKAVRDIGTIYKKTTLGGSDKTLMKSTVIIYDKDSLGVSKKYLKSGDINIDKLNSENGVIIVNRNSIYNKKTKKSYIGPTANMKVGDEIYLQNRGGSEDKLEFGKGKIQKVKVMAIAEDYPFDFWSTEEGLRIITTEEVAKSLTGDSVQPISLRIKIKDIKNEDKAKTSIEEMTKSNSSLVLLNNIESNRKGKSLLLMIQILIYGFVIVVSLISSVNIVNTLTTNIILRKREFAALKSIGLTQKGLKKMIVLEGLLYGIMGAIYGSVISCGLSFLMYKGLYKINEFGWNVPWKAMAIAAAAALIVGYISVLSPLSRIRKENIIETIKEE